jgi:hypothetical protein
MAQHDPKKPAHEPAHGHGAGTTGARSIEHIQADLDDVKAQLAEAMPIIESEGAKARRQLERIEAAKVKWRLTHEPDDPFDPKQYEPPMLPLKMDAKKQTEFHALHYRIARLEAELMAAIKTSVLG